MHPARKRGLKGTRTRAGGLCKATGALQSDRGPARLCKASARLHPLLPLPGAGGRQGGKRARGSSLRGGGGGAGL